MIDDLGVGRHVCPMCAGGRTRERSFSVWSVNDFYLVGQCKRASCGFTVQGSYLGSGYRTYASPEPSAEVLRPYTGDRYALGPTATRLCVDRWGFVPTGTQTVAYGTELADIPFILPILAPNGNERGVMEASYGENKRRRIWKAKDEPMISWTAGGDYYDGVYLVEDQISALRLHHVASIRAVALLGTSLNTQSVAEIQRNARHVTIALDADATAKAFLLARKWGSAFKSCNVQILTRDFKDMSSQEIREMMQDAGHWPTSGGSEFA